MSKHRTSTELPRSIAPSGQSRAATIRRRSNLLSIAVCALVIPGLLATVALPAYAASASLTGAQRSSAVLQHDITADAQSIHVVATADVTAPVTRASFGVVAPPQIRLASTGPSLASLLANPPYPKFSLGTVVSVASKYLGVPYKLGGESPAGFDCSGLVAYVYAQFGVALPHSGAEQGRIGTAIARSAALPGDVVVMDGGSHVGIYLGGDRMIDAPVPGRVVSNDVIYDNNYYFVRFGI